MVNLKRSLAPITPDAWEFIDKEARRVLKLKLSARKAVDFVGPKGIKYAAVNTGRRTALEDKAEGASIFQRQVLPLVEVEIPFRLHLEELEAFVRGAEDVNIDNLLESANELARIENKAIFFGMDSAGISGLVNSSGQTLDTPATGLISSVAEGINNLVKAGVNGPYTLLLGPELYHSLYTRNDRGYPLEKRISDIIGGDILFTPDLEGYGLLLSKRGGDFELIVGQDIAIGFSGQFGDELEFFLLESFTFRVNTPEAAVVLKATD
ncbi:family 1 encapsulin nanocompartment shell protein [Halothermothrix orenii]|uniref:Type 1 encapsulin shell protein n=1 Tax=Halothermothrix orenii (strain H 168 / OCM 544 / DSM 9562) TaxID=373903 RepID=B8CYH7_HALOH|nr:family 1 encapsulin nanocompartment shell protein [Halothermothrix orenii]ACL70346.1 Linocin_M18 bacteriocin protein [Halothermothrix orenii H 168]